MDFLKKRRGLLDGVCVTGGEPTLRGQALLDAACLGRGFLLRGGEPDEERGCRVVLEEFRSGKLGRITLESAPEAEA